MRIESRPRPASLIRNGNLWVLLTAAALSEGCSLTLGNRDLTWVWGVVPLVVNAAFSLALLMRFRAQWRAEYEEMLEKHKRMVGFDYEAAWKELERVQAGLSDLSRNDLWEQYYREPFRKKLGGQGSLG